MGVHYGSAFEHTAKTLPHAPHSAITAPRLVAPPTAILREGAVRGGRAHGTTAFQGGATRILGKGPATGRREGGRWEIGFEADSGGSLVVPVEARWPVSRERSDRSKPQLPWTSPIERAPPGRGVPHGCGTQPTSEAPYRRGVPPDDDRAMLQILLEIGWSAEGSAPGGTRGKGGCQCRLHGVPPGH